MISKHIVMLKNTLFRLYSMTRPITSLAAMILWEEGKFKLDDPIAKYLSKFENQRVFKNAAEPNMSQTRERANDITVEDLLLHTSGLGSRSSAIYRAGGVRLRSITLSQMVDNAACVPLFEDPGTSFRYGISTTILGRLIEIWSAMPFEDFLKERVFQPLGMMDTMFWVDPERADRLATVYRPSPEGELRRHSIEEVPFTERPPLIEGGVGLVSTTLDYLRFAQMFLNNGEFNGNRFLYPETIELMTSNRIPVALLPLPSRGYMLGSGLGFGFCIVMDPSHYDFTVSDGEFWWDGSAGTRFFIDPKREMVTVIMAQISPSTGNGFREDFKMLVYDAIVEEP